MVVTFTTIFFLAGVVRIELTPEESEASVLPLHHTPAFFADCFVLYTIISRYASEISLYFLIVFKKFSSTARQYLSDHLPSLKIKRYIPSSKVKSTAS